MSNHAINWLASREEPEFAGIDLGFADTSGWAALSITGAPQIMDLVLTNRTPLDVTAEGAEIVLTFRPGVLMEKDGISLAPQSEGQWSMSSAESEENFFVLTLGAAGIWKLPPGGTHTIRLTGIKADALGGSRATRLEGAFAGFWHPEKVDADDPVEVIGSKVLHIPVVRRHSPQAHRGRTERATTAQGGPFFIGVIQGRQLLNDGISPNRVVVRLMNVSQQVQNFSDDVDAPTKIELSWRTGVPDGNWGLIGAHESHLTILDHIENEQSTLTGIDQWPDHWQIDRHTIWCAKAGSLAQGEWLDLPLEIHTSALEGTAELAITIANIPDHDDIDAGVPLVLAPMAARDGGLSVTRRLELRGSNASLDFAPAEIGERLINEHDRPKLSVGRGNENLGNLLIHSPLGLDVTGPLTATGDMTVTGNATITGDISGRKLSVTGSLGQALVALPQGWDFRVSRDGMRMELYKDGERTSYIGSDKEFSSDTLSAKNVIVGQDGGFSGSVTVFGASSADSLKVNKHAEVGSLTASGRVEGKSIKVTGNISGASLKVNESVDAQQVIARVVEVNTFGYVSLGKGWRIGVTGSGEQLYFSKDNVDSSFLYQTKVSSPPEIQM